MSTQHLRIPSLVGSAAAAPLLVLLVALGACSSSGDAGSASGGDSAARPAAAGAGGAGGGSAEVASVADEGRAAAPAIEQQKVISTGNVQLRADDVGQAVFDVRKVVDEYAGTISEDDTETDDDGEPLRSRMVLRIPTEAFADAMDQLEKVATLVSSKRQSADVTTEVLDMDVRVQAQRSSIERIQVLFDNATSIKDVVSIEGELSRRQADLASLEAQQRYLADRTAMSMITLSVERTDQDDTRTDRRDSGFLAGLSGGWRALRGFLVAAATVAGALLPWLVLALLLAVPGWAVARRVARRQRRREVPAA